MGIKCQYCNKQFNTQAALNWHLQKDKMCISKRSKAGKQKPVRNRPVQTNYIEFSLNDGKIPTPIVKQPAHQTDISALTSMHNSYQLDTKVSMVQKKSNNVQPPPVPPKHRRASSKTELDFTKMDALSNDLVANGTLANSSIDFAGLQSQVDALKEANAKLMQDKLLYAEEVNGLKAKIIKQDEELHRWKDKLLTKKEKLVGEDLKNELITLILDSELNIQQVPDNVEREIYGFVLDKLANSRGLFTKLFCCK